MSDLAKIVSDVSTRLSIPRPTDLSILSTAEPAIADLFGSEASEFYAGWFEMVYPGAWPDNWSIVDRIVNALDLEPWRDNDGTRYELLCAGLCVIRPAWFVVWLCDYAVKAGV